VARDRHSVGAISSTTRLYEADGLSGTTTNPGWYITLFDNSLSAPVFMMMVVMMEGVHDPVSHPLQTTAEGMVLSVVVVVTHVSLVRLVDFDVDFFADLGSWSATLVFDVESWVGAAAVVSLGDVKLVLKLSVVSLATVNLNVNFGVSGFGGASVPREAGSDRVGEQR
jgi:hypothetical protein